MGERYLGLGARLTSAPSDLLAGAAFAHELRGVDHLFRDMDVADIAHVLSLIDASLVPDETAAALLRGLHRIHTDGPDAIDWSPALGDIYNNRTVRLTELIGEHSRALHTGRARRESTTVAWQLATRRLIAQLGLATARLAATIVGVADDHRSTVMSDYTYLQHAHPTTLAHYLIGFAQPLLRDSERLGAAHERLNRSPAESGSVNGSRLPLDRRVASARLGFADPMSHTRDAMWASDLAVEAGACGVSVALTLDRLAEELLIFSTEEFGFVELADRHCRTSVIMPQKKNPYGLAHIRGVARRATGLQAGVTSAQLMPTGQPDSRTVAYLDVITLLRDVTAATLLLSEIVADAEFDTSRLRALAQKGHFYATDLCDVLLVEHGMSNRASHEVVGRAVRSADERGDERITIADITAAATELGIDVPELDPATIEALADVDALIATRNTLGGAGPTPMDTLSADCAARSEQAIRRFESLLGDAANAEAAVIAAAEGDDQ